MSQRQSVTRNRSVEQHTLVVVCCITWRWIESFAWRARLSRLKWAAQCVLDLVLRAAHGTQRCEAGVGVLPKFWLPKVATCRDRREALGVCATTELISFESIQFLGEQLTEPRCVTNCAWLHACTKSKWAQRRQFHFDRSTHHSEQKLAETHATLCQCCHNVSRLPTNGARAREPRWVAYAWPAVFVYVHFYQSSVPPLRTEPRASQRGVEVPDMYGPTMGEVSWCNLSAPQLPVRLPRTRVVHVLVDGAVTVGTRTRWAQLHWTCVHCMADSGTLTTELDPAKSRNDERLIQTRSPLALIRWTCVQDPVRRIQSLSVFVVVNTPSWLASRN